METPGGVSNPCARADSLSAVFSCDSSLASQVAQALLACLEAWSAASAGNDDEWNVVCKVLKVSRLEESVC